ncbi:MAG: hypothetical protein LBS68_03310 [Puniceicoccales bacterium]|jgi:hypothetical protein|nr:hypothetical protein [Puniceicoccales bacterium]
MDVGSNPILARQFMLTAERASSHAKEEAISVMTTVPTIGFQYLANLGRECVENGFKCGICMVLLKSPKIFVALLAITVGGALSLLGSLPSWIIFLSCSRNSNHASLEFMKQAMTEIDNAIDESRNKNNDLACVLEDCKDFIVTAEDANLVFSNLTNIEELENFITSKNPSFSQL